MIAKIKAWITAAGIFLAVTAAAIAYGYSKGRENQQSADALKDKRRIMKGKEISNEIDSLNSDAVNQRLERWVRD